MSWQVKTKKVRVEVEERSEISGLKEKQHSRVKTIPKPAFIQRKDLLH